MRIARISAEKTQEAIALASRMLLETPDDAQGYFLRGLAYSMQGDTEFAEASYDRATVHAILDAGLVAHVGLLQDNEPVVVPMLVSIPFGVGGCGGGLTGAGLTTDSLVTAGFSGTVDFTTGFSGAGALAAPLPKAGIETRLTFTADGMYLRDGVNAGIMMNTVIRTMCSSSDMPM